ncbi:MAG: helix-turn-helix domain-containing protein [Deltaproteobacteria bacterium]|jgi:ribosome-binding protein aMBF1 (putative translation factor)|nr:helix-turn-helix domain-containing protein [Deltaproteobacteria bacterium]
MSLVHVNGEAFFEARLERFLSQEALAGKAGVSSNAIKRMERGQKIGSEITRKVLMALGISVKEALEKKFVRFG